MFGRLSKGKGVIKMAYETKVLLIGLADAAAKARSKVMYDLIAKMANAEGVILDVYEEAVKEHEKSEESDN
jgi:hypothetical protein